MAIGPPLELIGFTQRELAELMERFGQAPYRARQLYDALYRQRAATLESVSTLPRSLRDALAEEGYRIGLPEVEQRFVSRDGTVRYLLRFADRQSVEAVWMPDGDGVEGEGEEEGIEASDGSSAQASSSSSRADTADSPSHRRGTLCLSSQAGCAVNCAFCMTAMLGLQRNLTAGEIVGQVLLILNDQGIEIGRDRINLVFMGQGEPLLNYENFLGAVRLLVEGVGISASRTTVSTSGIVPRIAEFGAEPVRPHLAISLNASSQEQRERLMPITSKWKLDDLMAAARRFPLRQRERLTFEYVLLAGVNDRVEDARKVAALLRGVRAKVNLIALNPGPEIPFETPVPEAVEGFRQTLIDAGIPTYLRRPRGLDIYAACGQLKRATDLLSPQSLAASPHAEGQLSGE
jgi:23S rRNA (adenine2503-C2)-methyltransferase